MSKDTKAKVQAKVQAKEIAKELDRGRSSKKILYVGGFAGLVALLLYFLGFGSKLGLGPGFGLGAGSAPASASAAKVAPSATPATSASAAPTKRCALKVSAAGISVDGAPMDQDAAITRCRAAGGADVTVTGDAPEGKWTSLKAALEAARLPMVIDDATALADAGAPPPASAAASASAAPTASASAAPP